MDIGKGVSNHYKPEFEFSNFISFLYLFCAYIIVWKKILKNPIHLPFWVFSLIIHSLCFITHVPSKILNPVISPWSFTQWEMDIVSPLPIAATQNKFLLVTIDYFNKWVEVEVYASIKDKDVTKFV